MLAAEGPAARRQLRLDGSGEFGTEGLLQADRWCLHCLQRFPHPSPHPKMRQSSSL
jgi:hypothetical protein